ncbi:MAG: DUF1249 domain-containing protein [Pseudohongiellaceae bacterium]|nr:DUF1249 domain-containing protein [Pseudohongiellaceae bacterium]
MGSVGRYKVDLIKDMADCDANFIRLLKLMPELESYRDYCLQSHIECGFEADDKYTREFSIAMSGAGVARIRISVVEVFRYTSTLLVEQVNTVHSLLPAPKVLVRLYHDARTAEAIEYQGRRALLARYAIPNEKMYHQDEKRQINGFLGEWLNLCLAAGFSSKTPEFACTA